MKNNRNMYTKGLVTIKTLKGRFVEMLGKDQIEDLCQQGIFPHHRFLNPSDKSETLMFDPREANDWIEDNFLKRIPGDSLKPVFFSVFDSDFCKPKSIPPQLSNIKDLYKIPIEYIYNGSGIYFLCDDSEIVYIGQSLNIGNRITTHLTEGRKNFLNAFFVRIPHHQLIDVESALIRYYKPKYNRTLGSLPTSKKDMEVLPLVIDLNKNTVL